MAEYIKREDVLAFPIRINHCDRKHRNEDFLLGIETVIDFVEAIPAADVAEVRHGKWAKITGMAPPEIHGLHCCSLCGGLALQRNLKEELSDFCPNCGADMREVEHETD